MAGIDLPYKVDYAKSARARCRGCKKPIDQGCLRLAVMVQSAVFDGKSPNWYHSDCFFIKQRPKTSEDIHNFETIRWEDQQDIKKKIESSASIVVPGKKGKKRDAGSGVGLQDFKMDYAASSRAMCRGCEIKIMKGEVRIAKKDFESDVGKRYGGQDMWHHLACFAQLRSDLGYYECGDKLPGFESLKKEGQADVIKQLPAIKQEDIPAVKKPKTEDEVDGVDKELEQQTKDLYKFRDQLEKNIDKKDCRDILEKNSQSIPQGPDRILDKLADMFVFGRILPCPECKETNFVPGKVGYICKGNKTEWSKCEEVIKEPKRKAVDIPKELKEDHSFLKKYKYKPRARVFKEVAPTVESVKKEEENAEPRIKRDRPPLYDMTFVILGNTAKDKTALKEQIGILGGKVITAISKELMAVISTVEEVEKDGARMQTVKATGVHVVPESFLDVAKDHVNKIPELIKSVTICDWGTDPTLRLPAEPSKSGMQSKSKSHFTSRIPTKQKLTLIGGAAVDPESGLDDVAHVYIDKHDNNTKYSVVLGLTDIQRKKNSFYKMQLLEADKGNRYWVFRSWGRIGTTIGGNKVTPKDSLHDARQEFEEIYLDKTDNQWELREHFQKKPGRMYPVEVDYGEDEAAKVEVKDDGSSKLAKPIQELIKLIFNVNSMKNLMMEFELDMEKMPLGKLSKAQIKKAYSVLTELQNLIDAKGTDSKFIDASNRFYTFIPHSFGIEDPPVLKNNEIIKQKIDMLENLLELEIAFSMMKSTGDNCNIDSHYFLLKTDIEILPRDSVEFSLLQEYVTNTHAATHAQYKLEIVNVFTIARHGEEKRFKPFKKLHNRQLLWHGSRITNFAGILSQGLRIAPPEAPVTGYMFGKGIYFADMVSKSANYCCTNPRNPTGLLLLCDVALGDMYERKTAEYVEKLPKGKHSCKGVGRTQPDPKQTKPLLDTGVDIPLGTALPNNTVQTQLLYNEFIVYDIAQVNVKYMLQMNFNY